MPCPLSVASLPSRILQGGRCLDLVRRHQRHRSTFNANHSAWQVSRSEKKRPPRTRGGLPTGILSRVLLPESLRRREFLGLLQSLLRHSRSSWRSPVFQGRRRRFSRSIFSANHSPLQGLACRAPKRERLSPGGRRQPFGGLGAERNSNSFGRAFLSAFPWRVPTGKAPTGKRAARAITPCAARSWKPGSSRVPVSCPS